MTSETELAARIAALEQCVQALRDDVKRLQDIVSNLANEALTREAAAKERDRLTQIGLKVFTYIIAAAVALGSITVWIVERADQLRSLIVGPSK